MSPGLADSSFSLRNSGVIKDSKVYTDMSAEFAQAVGLTTGSTKDLTGSIIGAFLGEVSPAWESRMGMGSLGRRHDTSMWF